MKNYGALKSIPRQTTIGGQPHMLAYINPEEEGMIQDYRGNIPPVTGPDGVPAYLFHSSWGGGSKSTPAASDNDNDDKGFFESIGSGLSNIASSVVSSVSNFVSDVGQAAVDTVVEVATLGTADTQTYNEDKYNLNYDATGGNTTTATTTSATQVFYDINGVAHATQAAADAANAAILASGVEAVNPYKEYADSMLEANVLSLGGKQMPGEPDNQGNTPILEYTGGGLYAGPNIDGTAGYYGDSGYTVVGGLDPDLPASMSTNEDGTLFVPYDGQDPATINTDDFQTDLPVNGAAILNEIGKNTLLETGDDSKMITVSDGGGYEYVDGTQITNEVFETDVNQAIADGIIDPYVGGAGDEIVIGGGMDDFGGGGDDSPITRQVRGTRDVYGDFIGGRSGGLWNRFQNSYLTRFNQPTQGIDEMVRVVDQEDGSKLYYGADGALLNPELMEGVRLGGPTVSQKIGEEDVLLGTQTLDPSGAVISTAYTDAYDMNLDSDILAPNQVFSVTDPATNQLVTFPDQAQYDQFVLANQAALQS
jgi:hypothetical protein